MRLNSISCKVCLFSLLLSLQTDSSGQTASEQVDSITSALRGREFEKALQLLQPAIQSSPNSSQLWMLQGLEGAAQIEYEAGNADAIPILEHVLKIRPNDVTSHAMLAVLAEKNGDCATAVKHFSQSGPVLDSQPESLQGYGVCLLKLKQTDEAIRIFRQLLTSRPEDIRCRRALAAVQLSAAKPEDALATVQPLLDSAPDASTMRLAAAVYEANKDTPNAVKILREAIVRNPLETPLYVDFADIAMNHQSFQTGIEMINAGLKL